MWRLLLFCLVAIVAFPSIAEDTIEFNGKSYELSDNTLLLDAENIYNVRNSFRNPIEAFAKINVIGKDATLLVAPSVYWLDDPDDTEVRIDKDGTPYAVKIKCESLNIIGLTDNPEDVVFAVNRGQTQGAIGNYTMFHFAGKSLQIKNLTFGNYCNIDIIYPRKTEYNHKKRKDAIVQAQIGICENTDHLFAQNCRFLSRLNLCPFVGARRSLYDKCYFECTDDALSGSAIYLDCNFTLFSSKPCYSTAETGAVFLNCDIICKGTGTQYFTKVPGMVTAIDTRFHSDNPIEIKWTRDHSDVISRQYNISLNGKPYIIDSDRQELGLSLDESPLKDAYAIYQDGKTIYNIPNLINGDDGWDPIGMNPVIADIESKTGKKLTGIPIALRLKSDKTNLRAENDTATIISQPLLWGGYPSGVQSHTIYVSDNTFPEDKETIIKISTPDGLSARQTLKIGANLRKAPDIKHTPKIFYDEAKGGLKLKYTLSGKGIDDSSIMWGRIVRDGNNNSVVLLQKGEGGSGDIYYPKAGDLGNEIIAMIFPKYKDSGYGTMVHTQPYPISELSYIKELPESNLSTDFSDVPIDKREAGQIGAWSFDIYKPLDTSTAEWSASEGAGWYYGKGFDASTGTGIVQSEKGARMSYIPARDICHNMTANLIAEPAKSGGQGFGSATCQYMDICVKFDPIDLNGYALRIERTPDHDRAVTFSLIKYENGQTSVISDKIVSNCFRTPCHINVGIIDGILKASAYTDAADGNKCCDDVLESVTLSAPVEESTLTGFCIQHTGSTGPSSTLIRDLKINWE